MSRLQELVKLQGQLTHGTVFTRSSVETGARYLKNLFDSKCSTQELAEILNKVYTYIAKGEDLTWSGVVEAMQPAGNLWSCQ